METTAVYAGIVKHERNADGDLVVYGRATGPDLDLDQQVCDPQWLKEAMPTWLRTGGNVREQHSSIAAGVGQELTETVDGGWDLKALIVDPVSARKIERGVLKGYSIGIRNPVVVKDAAARGGRICGGSVVEVSVVDRPANPTCTLTLAKSAKPGMTVKPGDLDSDRMLVKVEELHEAPGALLKVVEAPTDRDQTNPQAAHPATVPTATAPPGTAAVVVKRDYTGDERDVMAASGVALPDGSYPIRTVADLRNAIQAIGRAKDPEAAKAHIRRRARALGKQNLIPDSWKTATPDMGKAAPDGMWVHDPAQLAQIRDALVSVMKAELDELADGDHELCDVSELLTSLSLFLAWWDHEAAAGETTSPYSGDDNPDGGPLMAVNLSAQPDTTKSTNPEPEKATAPAAPPSVSDQIEQALSKALAPVLAALTPKAAEQPETPAADAEKAAAAETTPDLAEQIEAAVAKAVAPIEAQVAKAMAQPAPGGPVLTRTHEDTQKAAAREELLAKAADYERLALEVHDPVARDGYLAKARDLRKTA